MSPLQPYALTGVASDRSDGWVAVLPLRTFGEKNRHEHWRPKAKRTKEHRRLANTVVFNGYVARRPDWGDERWTITLTRIAPRALDDGDNLSSALSAVRDGVADAFGLTDNNPRLHFVYAQRSGGVRTYAVEITIHQETT